MKNISIFILILISGLFSSCTIGEADKSINGYPFTTNGTNIPVIEDGYPPVIENESNFQVTDSFPSLIEIPEPQLPNGVVIGKLIDQKGDPYLGNIYLARTIKANQEGFPPMLVFSQENSIKSIESIDGIFVFNDVPPGDYGLINWTPISENVIKNNDGNDLIVSVVGGETSNLGEIKVK